jgi:hypothetical protein
MARTMKQHMAEEVHRAEGAHQLKLSETHHKAMETEPKGSARYEFHKTSMELHAGHAEHHLQQAEACTKAADGDLDKAAWPLGLSGVAPERPGVRAVPRYGQPETANVDPRFAELVKSSDDRDNPR